MADSSRPREDRAQPSNADSSDRSAPFSPSAVAVIPLTSSRQPRRGILPAILRRGFWSRFFATRQPFEAPDSVSDSDSDGEDQYEDAVDTLKNGESIPEPNNSRGDNNSTYSRSSDGSSGESNRSDWSYTQPFQPTATHDQHSLATRLFNVDPPERLLNGETWQVVEGRAHLPHGYQNGDGSTNTKGTYRRVRDGIASVGGRIEGAGRRIAGNLSMSNLSGLANGIRRGNVRRGRPGDSTPRGSRRVERRPYKDESSSEGDVSPRPR